MRSVPPAGVGSVLASAVAFQSARMMATALLACVRVRLIVFWFSPVSVTGVPRPSEPAMTNAPIPDRLFVLFAVAEIVLDPLDPAVADHR